jgi:hypothetical protein
MALGGLTIDSARSVDALVCSGNLFSADVALYCDNSLVAGNTFRGAGADLFVVGVKNNVSNNAMDGGDIIIGAPNEASDYNTVSANGTDGGAISVYGAHCVISNNVTRGGSISVKDTLDPPTKPTPMGYCTVVGNNTSAAAAAGALVLEVGGNVVNANLLVFVYSASSDNGEIVLSTDTDAEYHYNLITNNFCRQVTNSIGTDTLSGNYATT